MSGANASCASFQQAMEQVRQRMPSVTMLAIEHALRDCEGNVEQCVSALKKYAPDDNRVKYSRHQSYPQGMNQVEQEEIEKGIPYSNSWSATDMKKRFNTLGPNHRYNLRPQALAESAAENNPLSAQPQNDLNTELSSTSSKLDSSRHSSTDSVDSMAGAIAKLSMSKLPSVDETSEDYLTTRQERLDSLRKTPSLDDTIGAQRRQLEALEKEKCSVVKVDRHNLHDQLARIEMLNQQTEAFKDETTSKQQRLRFLQSRFPTVNKLMIDEQSSLVFTLEDDVAQDNETLLYLKKEDEGKWQCAHCTFLNFPLFTECEVCHFKKDTIPLWRT